MRFNPKKRPAAKVLVINCGSSSIKYKLYEFPAKTLLIKGVIERIGEKKSQVKSHHQGVKFLVNDILKKRVISDLSEVSAIGHRIVHGGETFTQPHVIDKPVIRKIIECAELAPLHNPVNLAGVSSCQKVFPDIPQVAVFDTAFHQTIPEPVFMYPLPISYYRRHKIRKYGFHGTSHQFVAVQAGKILKRPLTKLRLITCHLGNGCSLAAIDRGQSVDTSMGFTPLEGLMMGTRSGDIDVAAVFHLMRKEHLSPQAMDEILNKKSGILGVSGLSNDFRILDKAVKRGNRRAKLAYEMFVYRVKKYIGAYYFILGRPDAVCLTGGIGENSARLIKDIKEDVARVSDGKTKVLVIPTDEELMIADLTYELLGKKEYHNKNSVVKEQNNDADNA